MNKLVDWKNRLKKGHMLSVICVLLIIVAVLGVVLYKNKHNIDKHLKIATIWHFMNWWIMCKMWNHILQNP